MFTDLATSKKLIAAVLSVIIIVLGHFGIDIELDALMTVISPILVYIVGQGVADMGKEARKIDKEIEAIKVQSERPGTGAKVVEGYRHS